MKMHLYVVVGVVALAVTVVAGQQMSQSARDFVPENSLPNIPVDGADAPKPCCTPDQWEGNVGGFVGYKTHWYSRPAVVAEVVGFSYDAKNKRIAMNGTILSKKGASPFRIIELFNQKKMYVTDAKGKCVSHDLPVDFQAACVPADASFNGVYRLGLGTESLQAQSWSYQMMGYQIYFSNMEKQCIPLSETIIGKGEGQYKVAMLSTLGYTDITAGIKSASIFTPPKDCPPGDIPFDMGQGLMRFMHGKTTGQ